MALSPMMTHYLKVKDEIGDTLLFYRVGDFYEMFFEDAKTISQELELVLTGKDCGLKEKAPMCGVPHHASRNYIGKLVSKGYKVAICEQVEEASQSKGLVKREVVKIVTPGTFDDSSFIDEKNNNYIMTIFNEGNTCSISFGDISTGEIYSTITSKNENDIIDEISKFSPSEIILPSDFNYDFLEVILERKSIVITKKPKVYFINCESTFNVKIDENDNKDLIKCSVNGLLNYIFETQKGIFSNFSKVNYYKKDDYMNMDYNTRRNLEIIENTYDGSKKNTLLSVLDKTTTSMGARELKKWIEQPLIDKERILNRYDMVEVFVSSYDNTAILRETLKKVYDIERICGKIASKAINAKEMIILKNSIMEIPNIISVLNSFESKNKNLNKIKEIDKLEDIFEILDKSIIDNPTGSIKDGDIIKEGFCREIDELRDIKYNGKKWISSLEEKEREFTGIKSLKIGYNKIFGYYIEISKSNYANIPENRYIRKQTLSNAERFITEELKVMEEKILEAESSLSSIEYEEFVKIRNLVENNIYRIQRAAKKIATIDVFISLATVAKENGYSRPLLNDDGIIEINNGRHPVVEKVLKRGEFIGNDTLLDKNDNRIAIITGPNMAGKSTYMRQVALIVLMSQMGSFVPAKNANLSICDKIFTRIGASDDLSSGNSTFMVEMNEVSNILKNATNRSLVILDEVGRGTSTFDGLSIAFAVIEEIASKQGIGAKTLFATHYHELIGLEGIIKGIVNYSVSISEINGEIIFLRTIKRGGSDKSYGIEVAKLAGLPDRVINRAKEILISLEKESTNVLSEIEHIDIKSENFLNIVNTTKEKSVSNLNGESKNSQIGFNEILEKSIIDDILEIDISNLTPINALLKINELNEKAKKL